MARVHRHECQDAQAQQLTRGSTGPAHARDPCPPPQQTNTRRAPPYLRAARPLRGAPSAAPSLRSRSHALSRRRLVLLVRLARSTRTNLASAHAARRCGLPLNGALQSLVTLSSLQACDVSGLVAHVPPSVTPSVTPLPRHVAGAAALRLAPLRQPQDDRLDGARCASSLMLVCGRPSCTTHHGAQPSDRSDRSAARVALASP